MDLKVNVKAKIEKPIEEVFDAVYNPEKISGYFVTGGASGPLEPGEKVMWEFADHPGPFPVFVKEMTTNKRIVFEWEASDGGAGGSGYNTIVAFTFSSPEPGTTLVEITESGWKDSEARTQAVIGNTGGWMHMLCCLKAYAEYGINLRKGFF